MLKPVHLLRSGLLSFSVRRTLPKAIVALSFFSLSAVSCRVARADARFDLTGPKVEVRVTRAGVTLPIAAVPDLQPGDRVWVHADLPANQSVRYLMVLAFLRGTTNPPPENWFVRIETWDKKVREEGSEITVPDGAQQAVLFLAPVTGGDFSTLRSAVQGRPGVFVRAAHDLNLAGFEQARIEKYIASMREVPQVQLSDAKALKEHSDLIAGTLALKPNGDCVNLAPDQQYTCLTQSGNQTLLDDGHGQSIVSALSNGPGSDFINQASYTQLAGGGTYSAYVGAVVDLVRIMGSLHTAQYQYIPAIAFPDGDLLNLRLNTAPSFHNPKSVIVIGLPSIQPTSAPPLRPNDPKLVYCLLKPGLVLPVEGAPLVFSTGFAHDMVLHINYPEGSGAGKPQDLPLAADAYKGGLVVAKPDAARHALPIARVTLPRAPEPPGTATTTPTKSSSTPASSQLTGTIEGFWGFDTFKGPTLPLQNAPGNGWKILTSDPLVAGKDTHLLISSTGTGCVNDITLEGAPAGQKVTWKQGDKPDTVDVALDLAAAANQDPEMIHLSIGQYGDAKPAEVSVVSYSAPAKLAGLQYHAGDDEVQLSGTSLDEVKSVSLDGAEFLVAPAEKAALESSASQTGGAGAAHDSSLALQLAASSKRPKLAPGQAVKAKVKLRDGRVLPVSVEVEAPRPNVRLINKTQVSSAQKVDGTAANLPIRLGSPDDLPLSTTILFALKSEQRFPRNAKVEVASVDGSLHSILSVDNASLILEDPRTVLGRVEPLKSFGASAFGPIQVRAVAPDGSTGDWIPLATVVRLPALTGLSCPVPSSEATQKPSAAAQPSQIVTPSGAAGGEPEAGSAGGSESSKGGTVDAAASASGADSHATTDAGASAANSQPAKIDASGTDASASVAPTGPASTIAAVPKADAGGATCTLSGKELYLLDSVSADPTFSSASHVPDGYVEDTLSVPAPVDGILYLRLRDDPGTVDTVEVPASVGSAAANHLPAK